MGIGGERNEGSIGGRDGWMMVIGGYLIHDGFLHVLTFNNTQSTISFKFNLRRISILGEFSQTFNGFHGYFRNGRLTCQSSNGFQ